MNVYLLGSLFLFMMIRTCCSIWRSLWRESAVWQLHTLIASGTFSRRFWSLL